MIDNFFISDGATQRRHGKMLANLKEAAQWAFDFRIFHRHSQRRLVTSQARTPSCTYAQRYWLAPFCQHALSLESIRCD